MNLASLFLEIKDIFNYYIKEKNIDQKQQQGSHLTVYNIFSL